MTIILRRVPFWMLVLGILLELTVLVVVSDFFRIRYIDTPDFFSPLFYEQGGKNLLRFNAEGLAEEIEEKNPQLKNVTVKKKLPGTVIVRFETRKPILVATDRDRRSGFFADEAGVVFAVAPDFERYPLLVTQRISLKKGVVLDDPGEKTALTIVKLIPQTELEVNRLVVVPKQIQLETDAMEILLRSEGIDIEKLKALQFLVKRFTIEGKKPKKIDARFNKPIVIF